MHVLLFEYYHVTSGLVSYPDSTLSRGKGSGHETTSGYIHVSQTALPLFQNFLTQLYSSQLLVEHEDALATDPADPLCVILRDLGPVPTVESLIGKLLQMSHWLLQYTHMYTCTCTQEVFVSQHQVRLCRM